MGRRRCCQNQTGSSRRADLISFAAAVKPCRWRSHRRRAKALPAPGRCPTRPAVEPFGRPRAGTGAPRTSRLTICEPGRFPRERRARRRRPGDLVRTDQDLPERGRRSLLHRHARRFDTARVTALRRLAVSVMASPPLQRRFRKSVRAVPPPVAGCG